MYKAIQKKVYLKRAATTLTAILLSFSLCYTLTGCSGFGSKDETYEDVHTALSAVSELDSGKITVLSQVDPSATKTGQSIKSDLLFKEKDGKGGYQYCHTQYDKNDKPVFCEYSDGEKTQQWLIGKGWGGSATDFTKENPHRYIALLSTPPKENAVETITCEEQPTGKQYTLTLNPEELNKTVYKDKEMTVISEEISLLVDEKGQLLSYIDTAVIEDTPSKQNRKYKLQITLSEQNSISELPQPQLREYTAAPTKGEVEVTEK